MQAPRIGEISGCSLGNSSTSQCNRLGSNGLKRSKFLLALKKTAYVCHSKYHLRTLWETVFCICTCIRHVGRMFCVNISNINKPVKLLSVYRSKLPHDFKTSQQSDNYTQSWHNILLLNKDSVLSHTVTQQDTKNIWCKAKCHHT